MKKSKTLPQTSIFVGFLLYILGNISRAYIEPGSTSFLLKILISSIAGIAVAFRFIWHKVRLLYSKLDEKKQKNVIPNEKEESP